MKLYSYNQLFLQIIKHSLCIIQPIQCIVTKRFMKTTKLHSYTMKMNKKTSHTQTDLQYLLHKNILSTRNLCFNSVRTEYFFER